MDSKFYIIVGAMVLFFATVTYCSAHETARETTKQTCLQRFTPKECNYMP